MSYTHNKLEQKKDDALETKELLLEKIADLRKQIDEKKSLAAATLGTLATACGGDDDYTGGGSDVPVPDLGNGWKALFTLDPNYLYMNIGTQGSIPARTLTNIQLWNESVAFNATGSYGDQDKATRWAAAKSFGCDQNELAWSLNTTSGLGKICNYLKWEEGDDLITTNYEHAGGLGPMYMLRNRHKVNLHFVKMPTGVSAGANTGGYSDDEVIRRFDEAYAKCKKPKAILFSSPTYKNGVRLPEKKLCLWAASKGLVSIIDGAHLPGTCQLNFHDMGCDFFSGAGHKWQCGPGQTGILYIRNGKTGDKSDFPYSNSTNLPLYFQDNERIMYIPGSKGYQGARNRADDVAEDFMAYGNTNLPAIRALGEVCKIWDEIGRDKIEHYIVGLAQYLRESVAQRYGILAMNVDSRTKYKPSDPEFPNMLKTGLSNISPFNTTGKVDYNADRTQQEYEKEVAKVAKINQLFAEKKLVVRMMWNNTQSRANPAEMTVLPSASFRVSTHLFHDVKDVQKFLSILDDAMKL